MVACLLFASAATACGEAAPKPASNVDTSRPGAGVFPEDERAWPRFHSTRFRMSVPLPDGKSWKIDDHTRPELFATHAPTRSKLTMYASAEPELMNRARCEARARERGLLPTRDMKPIEDTVTVGPEAYDTRVLVAVDASSDPKAPLIGHVLLFGAFIRRCLFLHFETAVPTNSSRDEEELSSRLAIAKVRILGGLTLDPPRTGEAEVPREKEELKK